MNVGRLRERLMVAYRSFGTRQLAALGAASVAVLAVVLIAILAAGGSDGPAHSTAVLAASPTSAQAARTAPPVRKHRVGHKHGAGAQTRPRAPRRRVRRSRAATRPRTPRPSSPSQPQIAGASAPKAGGKHKAPAPTPKPAGASSITFAIKGGGDASVDACGAIHHYRTYAVGSQVRFAGTVRPIPSGRWKVKLKIKVCAGGSFAPFAKFDALRDKHRGTFSGSFAAPPAGAYSVRAVLYINGSSSGDSLKRHLQTD
jgi:hypothetical protein